MNDFFYKKRIAVPVFIIMVLFSVFVLGGRGLKEEKKAVLDIYYGNNEYDVNVGQEFYKLIGSSKNLLVIADKYLEKDHPDVSGLTRFIERHEEKDIIERSLEEMSVENILSTAASAIDWINAEGITDRDKQYLIKIEEDMKAAARKIELSGYYTAAYDFNKLILNPGNPYTGFIAKVNAITGLPHSAKHVTR